VRGGAAIDAPFSVPFSIAKDAETAWKRMVDDLPIADDDPAAI
jgi:hypothetical protein